MARLKQSGSSSTASKSDFLVFYYSAGMDRFSLHLLARKHDFLYNQQGWTKTAKLPHGLIGLAALALPALTDHRKLTHCRGPREQSRAPYFAGCLGELWDYTNSFHFFAQLLVLPFHVYIPVLEMSVLGHLPCVHDPATTTWASLNAFHYLVHIAFFHPSPQYGVELDALTLTDYHTEDSLVS